MYILHKRSIFFRSSIAQDFDQNTLLLTPLSDSIWEGKRRGSAAKPWSGCLEKCNLLLPFDHSGLFQGFETIFSNREYQEQLLQLT